MQMMIELIDSQEKLGRCGELHPPSVFHLSGHLTKCTKSCAWAAELQTVVTDRTPDSSHHAYFQSERSQSHKVRHTAILSNTHRHAAGIAGSAEHHTQTYLTVVTTGAQVSAP